MPTYTPQQQSSIDSWLNARRNDTSIPSGMTDAQRGNVNMPQAYTPPAMTQSYSAPPAPSTAKVNMPQQVNGSMYSQVPSTDWYSTNPSNQNSAKYRADGSPVATVGYDNQQTGQSYHGYATPEQFQQIMGGANNAAATSGLVSNMISSGQLNMPQSSIYNSSGGYAKMPMSAPQVSSNQGMPSSMPRSVNAPPPPAYTKNANVDALSTDQQLAYYRNNPAEARQELARAQGIGGSAAQLWANQLQSVIPQGQQQQPNVNIPQQQSMPNQYSQGNMQGMPAPANPYGSISPEQIKADAAAKIQAQITDRTRIANQTKTGYQTSYDRMNAQETDKRNLENFYNDQRLSASNGYSDYERAMIARERSTMDRQNQQDLQTRVGGVDAQLADFLNQTPDMQQQIINDMTKQERDYFLQTNAQALQAQNQQFNQGMASKQFDQQTQNQQFNQQQAIKQQHIDLATTLSQQYGVPVYPTDDPMLSYAQVAGIPTVAAQKMAMDAQNSNFDNAIKKALAENTINKSQADIMQQAQQLAISKQNANTSAASASNSNTNAQNRLEFDKQQAANKPKQPDAYKTDPNFASDLAHIKGNPTEASKLDTNAQPFIDAYGYDGYLALRKAAGLDQ